MWYRLTITLSILAVISFGCGEPPFKPSESFRVNSVFPITGPAGGATEVTIRGAGFGAGATVTVGAAARSVRVVDSTTIVATTPALPAGRVDVEVTNPNGERGKLAGAFTYVGLALTELSPKHGLPGDLLRIVGSGFTATTAVEVGRIAAPPVARSSTAITVLVPYLPPGTFDVTVANPDAELQTLSQAFTVDTVTISATPGTVRAGDPVTVTFSAPAGRPPVDWIGLFFDGDANEKYLWYDYTGGAVQGTITIPAPNAPGNYQFRYLADDGYFDAARTGIVTVTGTAGITTAKALLNRPGRGRGK
jgi:hypothetical protein